MSKLRIGLMGEIPPILGGAGLELQIERTGDALRRAGHQPVTVPSAARDDRIDVLHVFGSEPAAWHQLRHWTRNRVPLVVTSVVVVSPGARERLLRLSTRVPGPMTSGRMRAELLGRADAVVAGTTYEAGLVRRLGARVETIEIVGNGADPAAPGPLPDGIPAEYVLMVGAISPRKRQLEVAEALAGGPRALVLAGGYAAPEETRQETDARLAASGAIALGQVDDARTLSALRNQAEAIVHLSDAEVQSLAVLEGLAQGTRVIVSDIPSHRELAAAHPGWVELVDSPAQLARSLARPAPKPSATPPAIPTWDDVAERLLEIYRRLLQ